MKIYEKISNFGLCGLFFPATEIHETEVKFVRANAVVVATYRVNIGC